MLGVAVSTSVGEGPSEPLVAFEELDAFAAVRAAGAGREAAERTSTRTRDPYDDDDSAGGDPMGDRPSEEQINAEIQRQFEAQRAPRSANDLARPDGSPPRNGNVTPTNANTPASGSRGTQPSTGAPREGANSPDAPSQEAPR
jgi:hypothetical protein